MMKNVQGSGPKAKLFLRIAILFVTSIGFSSSYKQNAFADSAKDDSPAVETGYFLEGATFDPSKVAVYSNGVKQPIFFQKDKKWYAKGLFAKNGRIYQGSNSEDLAPIAFKKNAGENFGRIYLVKSGIGSPFLSLKNDRDAPLLLELARLILHHDLVDSPGAKAFLQAYFIDTAPKEDQFANLGQELGDQPSSEVVGKDSKITTLNAMAKTIAPVFVKIDENVLRDLTKHPDKFDGSDGVCLEEGICTFRYNKANVLLNKYLKELMTSPPDAVATVIESSEQKNQIGNAMKGGKFVTTITNADEYYQKIQEAADEGKSIVQISIGSTDEECPHCAHFNAALNQACPELDDMVAFHIDMRDLRKDRRLFAALQSGLPKSNEMIYFPYVIYAEAPTARVITEVKAGAVRGVEATAKGIVATAQTVRNVLRGLGRAAF